MKISRFFWTCWERIVNSFTEVTQVFKAASLKEAESLLQQRTMDLAILDLLLPDGDGSQLGESLIHHNPEIQLSFCRVSRWLSLHREPTQVDSGRDR